MIAFELVSRKNGQQYIKCKCGECGICDVVPGKPADDNLQSKVLPKIQRMGWSFIGKRLRCPACEVKRKSKTMGKPIRVNSTSKVAPPRQPTLAQKREINSLLLEVYDVEQNQYRNGDTDDTVADVLEVMPGWVVEIREGFFGTSAGNEDIEKLHEEIRVFLDSATEQLIACEAACCKLVESGLEVERFRQRLEKISAAVGARVMSKVKK